MNVFYDYDLGKKLNFNYINSNPFPNIVLDNFMNSEIAIKCFSELKNYDYWGYDPTEYVKKHQVNKFFTPWCPDNLNELKKFAPTVYNTLQYFNSEIFLQFLRDLTGIENLISDPTFDGGGSHKIHTGGKLDLHIDYNFNKKNQFRILNFLLYLNPDWKEEWEGALEFWDHKQKKLTHKIFPIFNRAAIFTLSDYSIHGHPIPLRCPEEIQRYSLALYYFIEESNHENYNKRAVVWHDI